MASRKAKKKAKADVTQQAEPPGAENNTSLTGSRIAPENTRQFGSIANASLRLSKDWLRIMLGASERVIPPKDPRFADPAWHQNPAYRRLAQGYLSFCEAVDHVVDENPDWRKRERARFLTGILTSSLAPTNTLLGNPAALKRAYETGGTSLLHGMQNMLADVSQKRTTPTQVNSLAFKVGDNLAVTPGSVVFRNEMVELLQYRPTTATVRQYPTLMIVPPIGKYYFMDLAPGRSFVEFAVSRGVQFFTTSWRNPGPEHAKWELDDYVKTCLEAVDAICAITNSPKVNILGLCAGGIIATLMLNYMAVTRDTRINVAAFGVMLLDFEAEAPIAAFQSKPLLKLARRQSARKGILPASSLSTVFAWMRPNDLVWNYWCNNYLMGKVPPSFDILAWSVDGTNLPAALHNQFLDIFEKNVLLKPGAFQVLGRPIDLKRIKLEIFVTGALTDHLTPWKACYRTTQLFGGPSTFILSNAGHIASLVNPPGNPKASYRTGPKPGADPDQWLRGGKQHGGTWWDAWGEWVIRRSGAERAAPLQLGNTRYPALADAPGGYVKT